MPWLVRFAYGSVRRHNADVIQELVPEAAVQQMQRGVLHAAVVPVDRRPVFERFLGGQRLVVVRVHIAQEVPGGACPLRHGVGLALCRAAAVRTGGVHPVGHVRQRGLAVVGRLVGCLRSAGVSGSSILRQRNIAALLAVYNRDRLAPVALAGEYPVAQLVVVPLRGRCPSRPATRSWPGLASSTVLPFRKPELTMMPVVACAVNAAFCTSSPPVTTSMIAQAELLGELPVAVIVRRHGHDSAGAVAHQNVVGNEDRDLACR